MTVQDRPLRVMGGASPFTRRLTTIPWWAIVLAVTVALLLTVIWSTPVWADSGGGTAPDDLPIWVIIAFVVSSLIGVQGFVASYRR